MGHCTLRIEGCLGLHDSGAGMHADALEELIDGGLCVHVGRFEHFDRMLELVRHGDESPVTRFRRDDQMKHAVRARSRDLV